MANNLYANYYIIKLDCDLGQSTKQDLHNPNLIQSTKMIITPQNLIIYTLLLNIILKIFKFNNNIVKI